jgi:hypothetical protein
MGHLWTVYMATDHNILSPASVRVFTVLMCVCFVHSEFVFLVPSKKKKKKKKKK